MAGEFPLLFSPLKVGTLTLKNRIASTSHDAFFAEGGAVGERYIRYHVEKARGGAGLIQCFGTTSVHPTFTGCRERRPGGGPTRQVACREGGVPSGGRGRARTPARA